MKHKRMSRRKKNGYALLFDIIIIALGILITIILVKVGAIEAFIYAFRNHSIVSSFLAGIFFTSTFTIAPAAVAIAGISAHAPISSVVVWGALGAMFGDLVLFYFIRDRFARDLMDFVKPTTLRHLLHSFHFGFLKWLSPVIGAFIIASPLPDEFAVSLLGFSKVRASVLMVVAFFGNIAGIYLLIKFANLFS